MAMLGACLCLAGSILTLVVLEWARHRQFLAHRESGYVPSTQQWCLNAYGIAGFLMLAATAFLAFALIGNPK